MTIIVYLYPIKNWKILFSIIEIKNRLQQHEKENISKQKWYRLVRKPRPFIRCHTRKCHILGNFTVCAQGDRITVFIVNDIALCSDC